jgi:GT2 family glycosyltransferase
VETDETRSLYARVGRLEAELTSVRADYLSLFDVLTAERGAYDAYIEELAGDGYQRWIRKRKRTRTARLVAERTLLALPFKPLVSIVCTAGKTDSAFVSEMLDSLVAQEYPNWEAIVVIDDPAASQLAATIDRYAARDLRIVSVAREPTSDGNALARAFAKSRGEFVARVGASDRLASHALFEVALVLNAHPDADFIYTDEDELEATTGRRTKPHFKPDWSPDSLLSRMYVGRLALYRRSLLIAVGGTRSRVDGGEDWDAALRIGERTDRIHHIADVLYHRRAEGRRDESSSASAERVIETALARRNDRASVVRLPRARDAFVVRYELPHDRPLISIVVPTRDHGGDVERCFSSIFERSTYVDFEVILVDNGSRDPASLETFAAWKERDARVRVLRIDEPFNFSRLNNAAVEAATGSLVLFLNNDTEIRTTDWLEAMAEYALRDEIGAVGATLLYPSDEIQHAGVVLAIGPVAGHVHKNVAFGEPGYHSMLHAVNNYSAVTAACLMVRKSTFVAVDGFDEELAVAYNDVDLCLKIRAAGYRNVCLPHVVLSHFESKSRGADVDAAATARIVRETDLMRTRWQIGDVDDPYYNPNLTLEREDYSVDV